MELEELLSKAVNYGLTKGCKYVELRAQFLESTSIEVRDGRVISTTPGIESGVAVRVLADDGWGFASTTQLNFDGLKRCVDYAVKYASATGQDMDRSKISNAPTVRGEMMLGVREPVAEIPIERKVRMVLEVDRAARRTSGKVKTTLRYSDQQGEKYLVNSEGSSVKMEESWIYTSILTYASEAGVIQSYTDRFGVVGGFEKLRKVDLEEMGEKAARKAVNLLKAGHAPAGKFPVVIDGDLAGLLAHEAFGHAAEADLVLEGKSVLAGKLGMKVASEKVSIVDDATSDGFGRFEYDDEGVKGARKLIVQRGVLRGFMSNRETSFRLGIPLTGNARAQDYGSQPIVRMSNTFFDRGDMEFEELIEDVDFGVYARGGRGGQVSTVDGVFQFGAQEAYLIEKGEITKPLRDFSMSGFILTTLKNVSGVGREVKLTPGFCGKFNQLVRVSSGGPHIRIDEIVVGGREWI